MSERLPHTGEEFVKTIQRRMARIERHNHAMPFVAISGDVTFPGFVSALNIPGWPEVAVTADTVLPDTSRGSSHVVTLTAAAFTVTLPTPVGFAGTQVRLRVTRDSTKLLTVATAAGTVDGTATRILWAGEVVTLMSDGADWVKVGGKNVPMDAETYQIGTVSAANGTYVGLNLNTVRRDPTGVMADTTAKNIVIRRPGTYAVKGSITTAGPATTLNRLVGFFMKNGILSSNTVTQSENSYVVGAVPSMRVSDDLIFAAGDTVALAVWQSCATAQALNVTGINTPASTWLKLVEVPTW